MNDSSLRGPASITCTVALTLLAGCATAPPPERMETSAATIRAAQEVGSADVPQADLYVQLAREQANRAKGLLETGGSSERAQAEGLFARAQADADLALALAREDVDKSAAQQAIDEVKSLQSENSGR